MNKDKLDWILLFQIGLLWLSGFVLIIVKYASRHIYVCIVQETNFVGALLLFYGALFTYILAVQELKEEKDREREMLIKSQQIFIPYIVFMYLGVEVIRFLICVFK